MGLSITGTTYVTPTGSETMTNKTITSPTISDPTMQGSFLEDIYTITDSSTPDINPANGSIQLWTLGGTPRTPTASNFSNGQSVTLMVNDGAGYTITWTTIGPTWVNSATAPPLATTGYTVFEMWKTSGTVYIALVGYVA